MNSAGDRRRNEIRRGRARNRFPRRPVSALALVNVDKRSEVLTDGKVVRGDTTLIALTTEPGPEGLNSPPAPATNLRPRIHPRPIRRQAPTGGPLAQALDLVARGQSHRHDVLRGLNERHVQE